MRVRRLLGRRKLPASKPPSQPALRGRVDDRIQQTPRSLPLPLPTASSPRHPNSFRMEHGLYKYTTGLRSPSSSIKRSFDVINAAFKVYSTKALSSSDCRSVRSLLFAEDNHSPATSLIAALRHLYNITAKAYTVVNSLAGVFFQVYREKSTLRPLRLPWITLSPSSRQWNISCETYRGHPNSPISVPRINLSIIHFREPFKVRQGPWSKAASFIGVQVCADLRTSILQGGVIEEQAYDHGSDEMSNASIQTVVDDIVGAMAAATRRSDVTNHEELITRLRSAISMNLKSSALPPLVKFRDLEIILMDDNRQRYVSNTLLNPDGSEQYGDTNEQHAQRASITVTGSQRVNNNVISESTGNKLGVEILETFVGALPGGRIESPPITAAELAQEFDVLCRNSDETGLVCCIKAIHAIERKHGDIHGRLAFDVSDPSSPTRCKIGEAVFYVRGKIDIGQHYIDVSHDSNLVAVRLLDSTETIVRIVDAHLGFDLSQDSDLDFSVSSRVKRTAADEVSVLSLAFESICKDVLEKMEFQSLDESPYKLAEAVLEILKIPSSGIMIKAVSLGIQPVDDSQTVFRAQASRETETESIGNASDAAVLPLKNASARGDEDTTHASSATHEASYQSPRAAPIPRANIVKYLRIRRVAADKSASKPRLNMLEMVERGELDVAITPGWTTSKIMEGKTGFEAFRVMLGWPASTGGAPSDITPERITQTVEDIIQTCSGSSVSSVQAVFSRMLDFEPHPQYVILQLRKMKLSLPIDIPGDSGRPGLAIIISNAESKSNNSVSNIDSVSFVQLPAFRAAVELDGQHLAPDTKGYFMFNFEGQLLHQGHDQGTTEAEQICRMFQIVHSISAGRLNDRSFPNLEELAADLTNAVIDRRQEFRMVIDVRSVKLTAHLRNHIASSRPIEKVEASKAVEPNVTEEGKAHAELPEDTRLTLDQEEEYEATEERELEVQSPETTLEILDTMNNKEATEEQSEFSVGSSTTIPESVFEAQATEEQDRSEHQPENRTQTAFIALGSNIGDRLNNIENACREMDADPDIHVVKTSPLYETNPMYVADQDSFLNGACKIETTLEPLELLDRLKAIEDRLGRAKTIEKGPRSIDLDILIYKNRVMTTDRLTIPHPLMQEREFVLRPLSDIHGVHNLNIRKGLPVSQALNRLPTAPDPIYPLVPLGPGSQYLHASNPNRNTRIMSVLNVTPDSFSDGGDNEVANMEKLQETIRAQIEAGATIIDVGGQSSRPNAPDVTVEEELSRVLPAIEAIRSLPEAADIAISVDTYRAPVAEAAVKAGAHIVNDISAGKLDAEMFATVARLGCTYVMMHMRGTPSTMMDPENCKYRGHVVREITDELRTQLKRAEEAGVRRWRIILDPGIGFSKTPEQNLKVLRQLPDLKGMLPTYPLLVGTSRKSFIGKITGVTEPKDRVWGTAATVTAAVQGGADIVRVHDVREMADVVKMADSMYRV